MQWLAATWPLCKGDLETDAATSMDVMDERYVVRTENEISYRGMSQMCIFPWIISSHSVCSEQKIMPLCTLSFLIKTTNFTFEFWKN